MDEQIDGINLQGNEYTFNINGVDITVTKSDTISSMMSKVNSSTAGVRMSYDTNTGQFKLDSKTSGGGEKIVIRDVKGNLMNQIFGAQGGNSVGSASLTLEDGLVAGGKYATADMDFEARKQFGEDNNLNYYMFDLTINGVTKTVRLDNSYFKLEKDPVTGAELQDKSYDLLAAANQGIKNAFGVNVGVELKAGPDGKAYVEASDGTAVTFGAGNGAGLLGFKEGDNNYLTDVNYNGSITSSAADFNGAADGMGTLTSGKVKLTIDGKAVEIDIDLSILNKTFANSTEATKAVTGEDGIEAKIRQSIIDQLMAAEADGGHAMDEEAATALADKVSLKLNVGFEADNYAMFEDSADSIKKYFVSLGDLNEDGTIKTGAKVYSLNTTSGTLDEATIAHGDLTASLEANGSQTKIGMMKPGSVTVNLGTDANTAVSISAAAGQDTFLANLGFGAGGNNENDNVGVTLGDLGAGNLQKAEDGYKVFTNTANGNALVYEKDGKYYADTTGTSAELTGIDATKLTPVKEELEGELTFSYNGGFITVDYDSDTKLKDLIEEINTGSGGKLNARLVDGKLTVEGTDGVINVTDTGNMLENVFGLSNYNTDGTVNSYTTAAREADYDSRVTKGKNLEVVVNGQTLSYNSNSFTIDGVTLTANQLTTAEEEAAGGITVNTVSDATETMDRIKSWIEEYNALVFTLNSAVNETRPKNNGSLYDPLTDEQKADMSESEIEKWEIEAKKGMLYNDRTIRSILSEMRAALYERVEAAGLSLYDLGLQVKDTTNANEQGQLEFMPSSYSSSGIGGEDKLRQLLESEPDKVRTFFQDPTGGLATKLNSIMDKAVNTSSVNRGSLITIAGTESNTGDNTSQLGTKMSAIDEYITNLKTRLENEYNRYWKQFSALEVAVSKMNSQSSWLTQQQ